MHFISILFFSLKRYNHAAVVMRDQIILVGGGDAGRFSSSSRVTGEIVRSKFPS